jgi:protein TonB
MGEPDREVRLSLQPSCAQRLNCWLIERAARAAPVPLKERLREEWLADLAGRRSALSRLRFALGCCWATRIIVHEHAALAAPAGAAVVGTKFAITEFGRGARWVSRRSLALLLVAGLHVALIYALIDGLGDKIVPRLPPTMQTFFLPDPARPVPPRRPQPPVLDTPRFAWAPVVDPRMPPPVDETGEDPPVTRDAAQNQPPDGGGSGESVHAVVRVPGGPGVGFPNADDYYPSIAKAMNEQGRATVNVCVDVHGRLTAEPTIVAGTNTKHLDAGALQLARAGSGRYRPTLEAGRPVDSCYSFRVRFQLKN